jgi:hypothetical protein
VGINHTIRFRDGQLYVRLSGLFQQAPVDVIKALSIILLSKLFRRRSAHYRRIDRMLIDRYKGKIAGHPQTARGRKLLAAPKGHHMT